MICECCMNCYKVDACGGRCDFKCENCSYNKVSKYNTENGNKEELLYKEQIRYRKKHKSCKHCIFNKYVGQYHLSVYHEKCEVKDDFIKFPKLKSLFCKYYKIK